MADRAEQIRAAYQAICNVMVDGPVTVNMAHDDHMVIIEISPSVHEDVAQFVGKGGRTGDALRRIAAVVSRADCRVIMNILEPEGPSAWQGRTA